MKLLNLFFCPRNTRKIRKREKNIIFISYFRAFRVFRGQNFEFEHSFLINCAAKQNVNLSNRRLKTEAQSELDAARIVG